MQERAVATAEAYGTVAFPFDTPSAVEIRSERYRFSGAELKPVSIKTARMDIATTTNEQPSR